MQHELRLSVPGLGELTRQLEASPDSRRVFSLGRLALGEQRRWLVHGLRPPEGGARLLAGAEHRPERIVDSTRASIAAAAADEETLVLTLGFGSAQGRLAAAWCGQGCIEPVQRFVLVGPGWLRLPRPGFRAGAPLEELLSRTLGALGQSAFRALQHLTIGVIGCGRIGSLVAEHLASVGVGRLILVDADRLEPHNLGEMAGVQIEDLGKPKAVALAQGIRGGAAGRYTDVRTVIEPVDTLPALFAVKTADILVSCADSGAARLAAAWAGRRPDDPACGPVFSCGF